jgi:hypothetical protein
MSEISPMTATAWRRASPGSRCERKGWALLGWFDLNLPAWGGLLLRGLSLHCTDDGTHHWVSAPFIVRRRASGGPLEFYPTFMVGAGVWLPFATGALAALRTSHPEAFQHPAPGAAPARRRISA